MITELIKECVEEMRKREPHDQTTKPIKDSSGNLLIDKPEQTIKY
jgi:hypothetical protein